MVYTYNNEELIEAMKHPYIVSAAIRDPDGLIITGARHFDMVMVHVMQKIYGMNYDEYPNFDDGFIDQFGRFYNRKDAWNIAMKNHQVHPHPSLIEGTLFSEDLY